MRKVKKYKLFIFITFVIAGCVKPYYPAVVATAHNYLVVEGLINSGNDSTFITLNRTVTLNNANTVNPELNALVTVEGEANENYILNEYGNGRYASAPLNLNFNKKYRLHIKANDGREYISDFNEAKNTPGIDSISYKVQNNGIQFYVNAHDPQNSTRYYRWNFDETWKYVSYYRSFYKLVNGTPTYRDAYNAGDNIYECYKTSPSKQIILGSSAKLGQDVIAMQPINFVDAPSGKASKGYSILLRQYALTPAAYTYWQQLKKNTEQLGTIFDAQPSSLTGNLHCITNTAEPVIGYISVSTVKSQRIFIDPFKVSLYAPGYIPPPLPDDCASGYIPIAPGESFDFRLNRVFGSGDTVMINSVQPRGAPAIIGYTYAPKECVDCRSKFPKGTNVKPDYWPY